MKDRFFRKFRQKLVKFALEGFACAIGIGMINYYLLNRGEEYLLSRGFRASFFGPKGFQDSFVLFFTLIVCVVVFILVFLFKMNPEIQYIEEIMDDVRRIGDENERVEIRIRGDDEFSELAMILNQMQQHIAESREREQQAENAKNDLVSSVAHDLRTPLTSILGYLDWVRRRKMDEATRKHYLDIAYDKAVYLQKLINELFGYVKLEHQDMPMNIKKLHLGLLIGQMLDEMQPAFEEADLKLICEMADEDICIEADGELMARLFGNLLNNAVKYGKEGKEVRVESQKIGESVLVRVINYGKIIPPEDLEHLFQKFYRGEQSRSRETGGTGLGLAIVKQIAEMHHGLVTVRSDFHGTVFEVELPLTQPKEEV